MRRCSVATCSKVLVFSPRLATYATCRSSRNKVPCSISSVIAAIFPSSRPRDRVLAPFGLEIWGRAKPCQRRMGEDGVVWVTLDSVPETGDDRDLLNHLAEGNNDRKTLKVEGPSPLALCGVPYIIPGTGEDLFCLPPRSLPYVPRARVVLGAGQGLYVDPNRARRSLGRKDAFASWCDHCQHTISTCWTGT